MKNCFKVWGLSFALLLAFCVPGAASAASCNGWSDIQSGTTLCTAAKYAYDQSIMYGYGSVFGAFKAGSYAEQFVNRAEAMAIILRALDAKYFYTIDTIHTPYADTFPFSDLPSGQTQWWYSYLRRMLDLGGVKGYADGTFQGGKRVTRAEFVKMFFNLTPYKNDILNMDVYGNDNSYLTGDMAYKKDAWYAQYFAFMQMNYPLQKAFQNNRCSTPNYCPDYEITRDEAALFLYYYHQWAGQDLGTTNSNPTPPPTPPTTLGVPVLFSPNNNMTYYDTNPTVNFNWYSTKGAVKYDLMIKYGANANYAVYQTVNPNYTVPSSYFPSLTLSPSGYLHRWKVRAYDANGSWQDSEERYLYVYNQNNLAAPTLVAPAASQSYPIGSQNMNFSWTDSGATSYDVMVRLDPSSSYFLVQKVTNTQFIYYFTNVSFARYYWKVRAYDNNGNFKDSAERYFQFGSELATPILNFPVNNAGYNGNADIPFSWSPTGGAEKYDFMIRYGSNNSYSVYTTNSNQYLVPASAFPVANQNYVHHWKVRAYDNNGNFQDSVEWALNIYSQAISAPTLVSPADFSVFTGNQNTTFVWNAVSGATKYDFMIQYGNSNSYSIYTVGPNVTQYYLPASSFPSVANNGYTHYWKVRAYDVNGNWKESGVRNLVVNKLINPQI